MAAPRPEIVKVFCFVYKAGFGPERLEPNKPV
jgi:hypothetical protein